jgi:hypothetical protein
MFDIAFEVAKFVAEMIQGLSLIVSPSTAALSQSVHLLGQRNKCSATDNRARRESQCLCGLMRISE